MAIGESTETFQAPPDPIIGNPFDYNSLANRLNELEQRLERYERQFTNKTQLINDGTNDRVLIGYQQGGF